MLQTLKVISEQQIVQPQHHNVVGSVVSQCPWTGTCLEGLKSARDWTNITSCKEAVFIHLP